MKFNLNTPLPQPLPKECTKAAKIFQSFVDTHNHGLDGFIPRSVLQHAKGFAIFSVFKAGFVLSARAGSGIVIARLADGSWSAPSAIGTAGMGFGSQAGAEMTDFLIILNSHSAVRSFMAAGSLTLGGNMSIAVGPLGRNGEASGALGTSGAVATMYSYSKTRGLFGGVSIEGSVIMERQDANALAYRSDVTAKMLLSGAISPPEWSKELIRTLENCTGMPGGRKWIYDGSGGQLEGYAFGGVASSGTETARRKKGRSLSSFPPASWGKNKDGGSYFTSPSGNDTLAQTPPRMDSLAVTHTGNPGASDFPTRFAPDAKYSSPEPESSPLVDETNISYSSHIRRQPETHQSFHPSNPFLQYQTRSEINSLPPSAPPTTSYVGDSPRLKQKTALATPLQPHEGIARAIALFDFKAVEPGDLAFSKGDVIVVTEKSDTTDDWWTGSLHGNRGVFPACVVH